MKIKQLKEKTIKGFIDFLPKVVVDNIEGLSNILNDKLSKSEGGEVNKPIVITNKDSNYSTTINPDGSIYIWDKNLKNNILHVQIDKSANVINIGSYYGSRININNILNLIGRAGNTDANIYDANTDTFAASRFKRRLGTDKEVLLGDGTTTGKLVKDIRVNQDNVDKKNTLLLMLQYIDGTALGTEFPAATKELAGLMTAADKTKLDAVKTTYLPLSGGTMTGPLNIDFTEGIKIIEPDLNPRNTYIGDGSIRIERLDGDSSSVISKTEINSDSITTTNATVANKIKANGFLANNNGNDYTAWTTNGESIDLIDLLSNTAIYVAGGFEIAESGIDNDTVVDNPDSIIYDSSTLGGRFFARKGLICYTHWNADISKNIAPPSRYGIETNVGVFPFNNQTYKFSGRDDIYIANCSNGTCSMEKLTLK